MRLRSSVALATLTLLALTGVARAAESTESGCAGTPALVPVAVYGAASRDDACLAGPKPLEFLVAEFQRAQAAERAKHRRERERRRRAAAAKRHALAAAQAKFLSARQAGVPGAAPQAVRAAIEAANSIATTPYSWGGGHAGFDPGGEAENGGPGDDCSGAVSFALHGGGFLEGPLDSTGLESWGEPGPGRWITVYANAEHAWMVIAGLAFDTVDGPGPRWHPSPVSPTNGFVARHPSGY